MRPRVLVVIVGFGSKNLHYLREAIAAYQAMTIPVDIVVTSNDEKDLGPGVEVVVGMPTKNPWSLPFAHKQIFAERVEQYDLFIFSEDDLVLSQRQIFAFLEVTPKLASDEVAGFLRYEISPTGQKSYPDLHGSYRWKPETVQRRSKELVAEFTNLHAGLYALTRRQLRRAISFGTYLRGPTKGEFDLPETAATDAYTQSGLRKVICISRLDDFLIHHRSNRYAGKLGISESTFRHQMEALRRIECGVLPRSGLGLSDPARHNHKWAKTYEGKPEKVALAALPPDVQSVLIVGCGRVSSELLPPGTKVQLVPLDPIVGHEMEANGCEVINARLEEIEAKLSGQRFDAVVVPGILHLVDRPEELAKLCLHHVRPGGTAVIVCPNFSSLLTWIRRIWGWYGFVRCARLSSQGIRHVPAHRLKGLFTRLGFPKPELNWSAVRFERFGVLPKRWSAEDWILKARRASKD